MNRQDAIGIGLSGLCLVHCLALPVLVALGPALVWMESGWVHLALAGLALGVSLNAMRAWPSGNRGLALKTLAATGLGLLLFGALAGIPELAERAVTVAGASLLALSHGAAWLASIHNRSHDHAPRR